MRGSLRFIAVLALVSGCSLGAVPGVGAGDGGTDSGSGSGSDDTAATMAFDSMITPIVSTAHTCTASGCHNGVSQPPFFNSFAAFKTSGIPAGKYMAKWDTNIINLKTPSLGSPPMHSLLPWLSTTEMATFMTFLNTYGQ
ncbi:MAG TPA: hypothetical protein VGM90_34200 [Kofleriaceae bacterium]